VVVYGDTNSTLGAAVAASKIHIPIVHIEAGLRSFNKKMPEEINRIMCDHASTLLFTPTLTGMKNLFREGFSPENKEPFTADNPGIFHCGDVMYDNSLYFKDTANRESTILDDIQLSGRHYLLGTIHRDNNTDQPDRLNSIFSAMNLISRENQIFLLLPLHPRTLNALESKLDSDLSKELTENRFLKIIPPVSFLDMISLESNCDMILTDSGGVQKEAYFFNKPCIILRSETEWKEIVDAGTGLITDANHQAIIDAYQYFQANLHELTFPPIFGDGSAAEFICETMLRNG
jgi:UDP-GlcNAc3NAcA epimerase